MASWLLCYVSGSSHPGWIPGQGHFVGHCVLGQDILLIQYLCISEFNSGGNPVRGWHLIQGGVKILLAHSCYYKPPHGAYTDLYGPLRF